MIWQHGIVETVDNMIYSIGYAGLVNIQAYISSENTANNSIRGSFDSTSSCGIKIAKMVNKAGVEVSASQESAQSAVRSRAIDFLSKSSCPGFGLCSDLSDVGESDAWPIIAVSVSPVIKYQKYLEKT